MPVFFYWGNDDFAIAQVVSTLQKRVLDPAWESFNYDKIFPEQSDGLVQGLNQVMTPPFGGGHRLVWFVDTILGQRCPEEVLLELESTLPGLPDTSVLLMTARNKPDSRLKSTKLLQKYAEIREFSLVPAWKTDLIVKQVRQVALELGVKLTPAAVERVAEAVGNDTRQLYNELEKLRIYAGPSKQPLDEAAIAPLVTTTTQNALKLAAAIRQGQVALALELVVELLRHNEPALAIVKTLIGQFRLWLWVKLMLEAGERDEAAIAQAAELANPKRLYFLKQEVQNLSSTDLLRTLPLLLELEANLKRGADELATLQTKTIELCEVCQGRG